MPLQRRKRWAANIGHVDLEARSESKLKDEVASNESISIAIDSSQRSFQFFRQDSDPLSGRSESMIHR